MVASVSAEENGKTRCGIIQRAYYFSCWIYLGEARKGTLLRVRDTNAASRSSIPVRNGRKRVATRRLQCSAPAEHQRPPKPQRTDE